MLKSGPPSENKSYPSRLNPLYLYLYTCSTFNHNINKNTIRDIWKVAQGINSNSNGGVSRTNQKGKYGGLLGYLATWFQTNGMSNIP